MEIKCEFKTVLWTTGMKYTAVVDPVVIVDPSVVKEFRGFLKEGKTRHDVQAIKFHKSSIHYIPKGIGEIFPNLQCFAIIGCGLKEIQRSDLAGFKTLDNLDLSGNKLVSLPDDLFMDMKNLSRIRLADNEIERASSKLLLPIEKTLTRINLTKNRMIDDYYFKDDHNTLEKIMLDLDEKCWPPIDSHLGMLETLLESGKGSDLIVKVGDDECKVHRSFLITQSPVLEAAIQADTEENQTNVISIDGFERKVVDDLLFYCYTGKIYRRENLMEVYEASVKYKMARLQTYCELRLVKQIGSFDATSVYNLGQRYSNQNLIQTAVRNLRKFNKHL